MSDKKIPNPIRTHNPAAVQLNRFLLREAMHDQELIEGILEGRCRGSAPREALFVNFQSCPAEIRVYDKSSIGTVTERCGVEIESESEIVLIQAPSRAGIEKQPSVRIVNPATPFDPNIYI